MTGVTLKGFGSVWELGWKSGPLEIILSTIRYQGSKKKKKATEFDLLVKICAHKKHYTQNLSWMLGDESCNRNDKSSSALSCAMTL